LNRKPGSGRRSWLAAAWHGIKPHHPPISPPFCPQTNLTLSTPTLSVGCSVSVYKRDHKNFGNAALWKRLMLFMIDINV
jgi:hypothetical protein